MTGLIGLSKAKVGDYVGQNPNPVVLNTVSDINPIHVRFPVGEREYLEMARRFPPAEQGSGTKRDPGKVPLELSLADGTVHPHLGQTKFVERNIDASTGTLTIEATFPNPELILRPGQYGRVRAQKGCWAHQTSSITGAAVFSNATVRRNVCTRRQRPAAASASRKSTSTRTAGICTSSSTTTPPTRSGSAV